MRTNSCKTSKLRNIYTIGWGARNIYIKKWEMHYFKIKIIPFIINFRINYYICYGQVQVKKRRFKIRKNRLILRKFSRIYLTYHLFKIRIINIKQSKKEDKDQESIQSSTTPDPGYQWESNTLTIRHHKREPNHLNIWKWSYKLQ